MLASRPAEFRLLASNLSAVEGYWAAPSGVFTPIPPRTVRALLTLTFGPKD
jgi:iron complex outermembrane receptor protein